MKISYNWLKQFLQIDWDSDKTAELLTDLGLEVEGVKTFESVAGGLKGIVVGHVLSCEQHPNADRLKLTKVDVGNENILQIVCGAANVEAGQKVPVALIGTTLYDKDGNPWQIKKGKLRGEVSEGMICAEDEIGVGDSHEGIMVLSQELVPGTPCAEVFNIETDQVFEIGLTPNRADAMSHYGVARDLKAGLLQKEISLELITPSVSSFNIDNRILKIDVEVANKDWSPRYCGITISDVTIKSSPSWLQNRLKAIGLTPINNVVDVTNYVLHELGQPLHAFDAKKIKGDKIIVKKLEKDTLFTTLDGVERKLDEDDLMICDIEKPLCIAGVFGGLNSGVSEDTTHIFLESAYFDPIHVRKTSKRHGLNTDASFRFERGVDINKVEYALLRAVLLIQEVAGGTITSDVVDVFPKKIEDHQVFLNFEKVNALVGQEIPKETIKRILTSLEIKVNNVTETGIGLTIPFYRVDVKREADVIEEILRVYGYNNIAFTGKLNASISTTSKYDDHRLQNIIADQLAAIGFNEIMTNSLTSPDFQQLSEQIHENSQVKMLNPLSNDLAVMRQSLLFSGMEVLAFNINRKKHNLRLFEFGKTYHQYDSGRTELKHLGVWISGNKNSKNWKLKEELSDFFYLKSVVYRTLERLGIGELKTTPFKNDIFAEGLILSVGKKKVVEFGVIKKKIRKHFDLKQEVLYADFNWDALIEIARDSKIQFKAIPKFPEVKRDFSLLVDKQVEFNEVYSLAKQSERKLLKDITLFDVYEGDKLPEGKKSYAVSFVLQDTENTLTEKQIDKVMKKLKSSFEKQLSAELR
ncbi:phenylalanine--tRNA ligase subunit beta [Ascidiimonas sp. W6]|uniref:phenylalanine--tRNA ligase subunit beta n=1 Tax=Ascidiimonas meishanensis TaxID=3128903 RepID=UPI0030EE2AFA